MLDFTSVEKSKRKTREQVSTVYGMSCVAMDCGEKGWCWAATCDCGALHVPRVGEPWFKAPSCCSTLLSLQEWSGPETCVTPATVHDIRPGLHACCVLKWRFVWRRWCSWATCGAGSDCAIRCECGKKARLNSSLQKAVPVYWKSFALPETSNPMMRPNSPNTELKISITRILTNLRKTLVNVTVKNRGQTWVLTVYRQQHLLGPHYFRWYRLQRHRRDCILQQWCHPRTEHIRCIDCFRCTDPPLQHRKSSLRRQ